jgi:hypothetical protein
MSPTLSIHDKITYDIQSQIIEAVTTTINRYNDVGNCFNARSENFDEDKYLEFIALFAGNAQVLDDLTFSKELLPYAQYAQNIFDNLQEYGVPFILQDVIISKIDIDDSGFYVIDVNLTKRLFAGLSENGKPVKLNRGRKVKLNMRIDLPDYLLSDARIQYIKLQKPKKISDYVKEPIRFISRKFSKD